MVVFFIILKNIRFLNVKSISTWCIVLLILLLFCDILHQKVNLNRNHNSIHIKPHFLKVKIQRHLIIDHVVIDSCLYEQIEVQIKSIILLITKPIILFELL